MVAVMTPPVSFAAICFASTWERSLPISATMR